MLFCCVFFVCCLFVRKANGRGERFYHTELPLPTSRCCLCDGDVATDVFRRRFGFYSVFFVTSNISSDVMFVSMVIIVSPYVRLCLLGCDLPMV